VFATVAVTPGDPDAAV
jgi:hypothetical protein